MSRLPIVTKLPSPLARPTELPIDPPPLSEIGGGTAAKYPTYPSTLLIMYLSGRLKPSTPPSRSNIRFAGCEFDRFSHSAPPKLERNSPNMAGFRTLLLHCCNTRHAN